MVEEMEAEVEINIEKQNEDKLKDFSELFNGINSSFFHGAMT